MNFHPFTQKLFEELLSQLTIGFVDQDIRPMTYEDQIEFFSKADVRDEMQCVCEEVEIRIRENYEEEEYTSDIEHGEFREHIYGDVHNRISLYAQYKPYEDKMQDLTNSDDEIDEMLNDRNITFEEFIDLS